MTDPKNQIKEECCSKLMATIKIIKLGVTNPMNKEKLREMNRENSKQPAPTSLELRQLSWDFNLNSLHSALTLPHTPTRKNIKIKGNN